MTSVTHFQQNRIWSVTGFNRWTNRKYSHDHVTARTSDLLLWLIASASSMLLVTTTSRVVMQSSLPTVLGSVLALDALTGVAVSGFAAVPFVGASPIWPFDTAGIVPFLTSFWFCWLTSLWFSLDGEDITLSEAMACNFKAFSWTLPGREMKVWDIWCIVFTHFNDYIDGLVRERRNSSALAMELRLSCTNPSIYNYIALAKIQQQ